MFGSDSMKIIINYDLLAKINEARTGFSFQETVKPVLIKTGFSIPFFSIIAPFFYSSPEQMMNHVYRTTCFFFFLESITYGGCNLILAKRIKNKAKDTLKRLSSLLKEINVNTNDKLILNSYKYKTEYKINKNENFKDLVQNKYIIVLVIENGEEKEISILQEHIIGSKIYSLSLGKPQKEKVFKLALNPM